MPRTVSEIKRIMESEGTAWTPELRAYAIANGAVDDAPKSGGFNPGFVMGPGGMQFNPLAANVVSGAVRGATAGIVKPPMVGSTGGRGLDFASGVAGQVGELGGMAAATAVLPAPAVGAGNTLLTRLLARMAPGAVKGLQYGAIRGGAEQIGEGAPIADILKAAALEGGKDAAMFGGLAGIPSLPARLGGAYGQSALIGAGLGGMTGGAPGALAGALAFPISHAITGPAFAGRDRPVEDPAVARRAAEAKILNDLLAEQYAEQKANEAFQELQSKKFEDLVPAKGEVQKRREYEKTRGRGSLPELAADARLELVDAPEDARTAPYEGPKVPLLQGMGDLVSETPAQARERIRQADRVAAEEALASHQGTIEQNKRLLEIQANAETAKAVQFEIDRQRALEEARWSFAERTAQDQLAPTGQKRGITPEEASSIAPSLVIPGAGLPGQLVRPGARVGGPIEVVPGGSGEPVGPVLRRPGSMATARAERPLLSAEDLVDATTRTVGAPDTDWWPRVEDQGPLGTHNIPTGAVRTPKPGFLRTAEDRVPPDSQVAPEAPLPPEAPVVPPAPEVPAPPEQGAATPPAEPPAKPKRRPGQKKPPAGDVTLGIMGGGVEQLKRAFRRPGQKKASEDKRPGVKKDNILASAFLPTEVQIARQSPEARKVAEMLHAGKYGPKQSGGRFARALVEYRSSSMSPDESMSIGQAIQGFKNPDTLTPKARNLMDITRRYLKEVAIKSGAVDMKLYTVGGKRVAFPGPKDSFFPHITVKTDELKVDGKARDRVIKNAVAIRAFGSESEAGEMLDSYVDIAESGMHARNKKMAERLMARGKANSVEEAIALIQGNQRNDGPGRFGSLEYAREFDNPFYEPDFNKAMTQYSREAERRIAETREWGQDNERIKIAIAQIRDRSERQGVELTAETAKGVVQSMGKPIDDAAVVMRRFGSYMMSPLSAIRNTGQSENTTLLTDFKSTIKAINFNRESRLRAIESGATSGAVLHDVEMGKGGAPSYQKIIGQTGTEVLLRTHGNNAGMNYFHDYVDRIRKTPNNKFVAHELRKMGFTDADIVDLGTGRELTRTDYNKAGFNIAARGQFMYDELDVPAWFNHTQPGKTVSQFRPWIVQQSHLIYDETVGQWKGGTVEGKMRCLRNVGLLATLYPLRGEVLNDFVALLQGKKRESNLFLRYLEDAAQMGVLTVVSDVYNAVQYSNAEGLMMGASLSKSKDMFKIASALAKNGKLSLSEQRLVFRMVPIIGPLFAYRLFPQADKSTSSGGPPDKVPPKSKLPSSKAPATKRPGQKKAPRN